MVYVTSRAQWGARPPKNEPTRMPLPAPGIFIHHTDSNPHADPTWADHQQFLQDFHMDKRHWDDIAYSFVIYPDGSVLEGRGWGVVGAHTKGHNSSAHGFCFAGSFTKDRITDEARDAARELWQTGTELGKIAREYELRGHRDVESTACPGDTLYKEMPHLFFV